MAQDQFPGQAGGEHVFRKLDEVGAMLMRTREDVVETKAVIKGVAEAQARQEKRQNHFEAEVERRFVKTHEDTERRFEDISKEVKTIREERIAEKAQWRGPEKVIAALAALGGALGAFIVAKGLIFAS